MLTMVFDDQGDCRNALRSRCHRGVGGEGVYAFFLAEPGALPGLSIEPSGLIYLGKSSDLQARNHSLIATASFRRCAAPSERC